MMDGALRRIEDLLSQLGDDQGQLQSTVYRENNTLIESILFQARDVYGFEERLNHLE